MTFHESSYFELMSVLNKPEAAEIWGPDCEEYMNELSGMGLQRLLQEPQRLKDEHTALTDATQDLAFNNYKTFVQTATCSRDIFTKFQSVSDRLGSLEKKLPSCSSSCEKFASKCADITNHWKMTSQTLTKHKKLVEILEIPQLMESCVKNGHYDEALELASYVRRLERRHPNIPIVVDIAKDVRHYQQYMQNQLLNQLRTNIQLTACLKVISYLRRMEVYGQQELKAKFLGTRGSWFDSLLASVEGPDSYHRLDRVIELCRVHLFDIITQYKAIFPPDSNNSEYCIFQGWIIGKIQMFLSDLRNCLAEDNECRLDALMSQCMYFGFSFSRVGTDFRPLLAPIFGEALQKRCDLLFDHGYPQCLQQLQNFDLSSVRHSSVSDAPDSDAAPLSLLDTMPLAVYCNAVLNVFNELRTCPLVRVMCRIFETINKQLTTIAESISALHSEDLNESQKRGFLRLTDVFASDLVNFISRVVATMLPPTTFAKTLGCPVPQVEKITTYPIDSTLITKSISKFIFAQDDDFPSGDVISGDSEFTESYDGERRTETGVADLEAAGTTDIRSSEIPDDVGAPVSGAIE